MPCLDEAETLEGCIENAKRCISLHGLHAEIIVADNGSTDGSQQIAVRCGARVVPVSERSYGAALMGGLEAARGRYLVMGDADQSYDFGEAFGMIERLRGGADLVMGSRFIGRIEKGAMPWSHRWIGNPILSFVGRVLFRSKISDFHCGLRALTKQSYERLGLRTTGMEFASELVVKANASRLRIEEVPITLHPDGRSRPPHLRTSRDGWRHLRFMLTLSPRFTLFFPGLFLMITGGALLARLSQGPLEIGSATLDIHSMQLASLVVIVGYQAVTTAIAARIFAVSEEIGPAAPWMQSAFKIFTLERGLLLGLLFSLVGFAFIGSAALDWIQVGFGLLVPSVTMRPVSVGATFIALGVQTLLMSLSLQHAGNSPPWARATRVKALDRFLQRWRIRMTVPFVRRGDRLLDVGCYDRSLIDRVLPRIRSAVGIDTNVSPSSDGWVEILRGCFPDDRRFDDACFDCITMLAVLEHVDNPAVLTTECERILASGGCLVLTVPHPTVDIVLDALMFLGIADGMAAEEHHGFDVAGTRSLFETAKLSLYRERRFQLGLNRLYVFEKPRSATCSDGARG